MRRRPRSSHRLDNPPERARTRLLWRGLLKTELEFLQNPRNLQLRRFCENDKRRQIWHGGFGCTIRSVPWRWFANGFCAFDKLFYNRNSIRSCERSHGNRDRQSFVSTKRSQSLLGCDLPTFHVVFQESNLKSLKLGRNCSKFRNMPTFLNP